MKKVLIFVLIGVLLLFSCEMGGGSSATEKKIIIPPGFIGGIGEGSSKSEGEADNLAKANALKQITEQLYVKLSSSQQIEEIAKTTQQKGMIQETYQSTYKKIIETTSLIDFVDVDYTYIDKRFQNNVHYVKVLALVDEDIAKTTVQCYIALELSEALIQSKMFFTAKSLVDYYDGMIKKYGTKIPATASAKLTKTIGEIRGKLQNITALVEQIERFEVKTFEDALKVSELLDRLQTLAVDLPDEFLVKQRERIRSSLKDVKIVIEGPQEVIVGQTVTVNIKVDPAITTTLRTVLKNIDGPESISVVNGEGLFSGVIKDIGANLEVTLAGILTGLWAPGKILPRGAGVSIAEEKEEMLVITSEGAATLLTDLALSRNNALQDAVVKTVKRAASLVLTGEDRKLLNFPIDSVVIDRLIGLIKYEIVSENKYEGLYYTTIKAEVGKKRFTETIKDILSKMPTAQAVLIVEGDKYNYIESKFQELLINGGIKLVSKEFIEQIKKYQQETKLKPENIGKLSALTAAKYLLYTKVNLNETYVADYKIWSVRALVNTQVIDTITGEIVLARNFEEVNSGATVEAGLSKMVSNSKFGSYVDSIIRDLKAGQPVQQTTAEVKYTVTLVSERLAYINAVKDYIAKEYQIKILQGSETKLVMEITTKDKKKLIDYILGFKNYNVSLQSDDGMEISFVIKR